MFRITILERVTMMILSLLHLRSLQSNTLELNHTTVIWNGHATILSGAEGNPRTYFILVPINKSITCNMRFDSMNINIFESYWQ